MNEGWKIDWPRATWEDAQREYADALPKADKTIALTLADIKRWPHHINDGETLAQILANLNYYVMELGELHARTEPLKMWTEKRYEAEKGIEKSRLIDTEKKAVGYADGAKYTKVQQFIGTMVSASALHLRVQNARSSARDTTEAIRSRIGQIRGAIRSS